MFRRVYKKSEFHFLCNKKVYQKEKKKKTQLNMSNQNKFVWKKETSIKRANFYLQKKKKKYL